MEVLTQVFICKRGDSVQWHPSVQCCVLLSPSSHMNML